MTTAFAGSRVWHLPTRAPLKHGMACGACLVPFLFIEVHERERSNHRLELPTHAQTDVKIQRKHAREKPTTGWVSAKLAVRPFSLATLTTYKNASLKFKNRRC